MDPWGWDQFGPLHWALLSVVCLAVIASTLASSSATLIEPRLLIGWSVLLGALTISSALSDDRWHAVVGTPDRHLGLVTWLLFFGLFVSSLLWFSRTDDRGDSAQPPSTDALLVATAGSLVVVALYGLLELRGVGGFASEFAGGRIGGTFGQPAYLGAAAVLALPLAGALAAGSGYSTWQRALGALASLGGVVMLAASQSRGAWVGFVIAILTALVINRRRLATLPPTVRNAMFGSIAAAIIGVVALPSLRRWAWSLTDLDGVIAGRTDEWQVGLRTISSAGRLGGFVGLGPEAYRTRFGEFVDEQYVIDYGRLVFTDRAHNTLVDTALAAGWIGLIAYLLVIAVVLGACLRLLRGDTALDIGIAIAALAYFFQQLFLFPLAELDPLFWVVAGLAVARANRSTDPNPWALTIPKIAFDAGAVAAGALALVALVAGGLDVMADRQVAKAVLEPSYTKALDLADSARNLRPDSIRYDFIASRIAQRELPDGFERALVRLDDGLTISPTDPALLVEQASLQLELARFLTTDESDDRLAAALESLEHLDIVDPNNPRTQGEYGIALALAGSEAESIARLERAVALLPEKTEPLINLAEVQDRAGQRAEACDSLRAAAALSPADTTVSARLSEKGC